jgi:hypothetical protein
MNGCNMDPLAVPWLRRLVADLSSRRPGFALESVQVGFVVDKVALGLVFSDFFAFPLPLSFHRGPMFMYHLGDEQLAQWFPQFRDVVSTHQHEQQQQQH